MKTEYSYFVLQRSLRIGESMQRSTLAIKQGEAAI